MLKFRVLDHSSFRRDAILGEQTIILLELLSKWNGKIENQSMKLNLETRHNRLKRSRSGEVTGGSGTLQILLDGMRVDMRKVSKPITNGIPAGAGCYFY